MTDPRLLLIDFTPMTGSAATSVLKAAFFDDWRDGALLHVSDMGKGRIGAAAGMGPAQAIDATNDGVTRLIDQFQPDVVLYRPVADSAALHEVALKAIHHATAQSGSHGAMKRAGLALWLMDDWPARLQHKDAARFREMDAELRSLLSAAGARFAISDGMAAVFAERYGVDFAVAHNGVRAADWPAFDRPAPDRDAPDRLVIRYAGSLAPDTTKDSVFDVARAVASLEKTGPPVIFEGRSHKIWLRQCGEALNALPNVSFSESNLTVEAYRRWLGEADILLVAYNFDEHTRTYLQYSFANKLPETMAAGAAVLAYGPEELETIHYLQRHGVAEVVCARSPDKLCEAITRLALDPGRRRLLGDKARNHALSHFDLAIMKAAFKKRLADTASPHRDGARSGDDAVVAAAAIAAVAERPARSLFRGASVLGKIRRALRGR